MTPEANSRPGDRRKRPRGMNITSNPTAAAAALRGRAKLADQGIRLATTSQANSTAERYTPVRMPMRNVALRSQENHREPGGWELGMGSALIPGVRPYGSQSGTSTVTALLNGLSLPARSPALTR